MSWKGPELDSDQRDVLAMVDDFTTGSEATVDDASTGIDEVRMKLVDLGLWTAGVSDINGGADADALTTSLVWQRVSRSWPALGWASVQAHAALDLLEGSTVHHDLRAAIHSGTVLPAIVITGGTGADLQITNESVSGTVHRVDVGDYRPQLISIDPRSSTGLIIDRDACHSHRLERTGLQGARTAEITIDASVGNQFQTASGPGVSRALERLLTGLAAVAAGVADAAADEALAYAGQRRQFGDVLTAIPTVRETLAKQQILAARLAAQAAQVPTGLAAASAIARDAVTAAVLVTTSALQSHGGYGYLKEYSAERRLRDSLSLQAVCDLSAVETACSEIIVQS